MSGRSRRSRRGRELVSGRRATARSVGRTKQPLRGDDEQQSESSSGEGEEDDDQGSSSD